MATENNGGRGIKPGDPRLPTDVRHSYEDFTQRPFYKAVNRQTLDLAPLANIAVLDIATGTGGMVELMLENPRLLAPNVKIHGVDIDESALVEARGKFRQPNINFSLGRAESTGVAGNAFDLVSFCNAIHLTNVPESLKESFRVLKPDGVFVANSAFVKDVAYPGNSRRLWMRLIGGAVRDLREMDEMKNRTWELGHPEDHFKHTREEYEGMARAAGFKDVETTVVETLMDRDDVRAICSYREFAMGALPGIPFEVSKDLLLKAADGIFDELREKGQPEVFPRNWLLMKAIK